MSRARGAPGPGWGVLDRDGDYWTGMGTPGVFVCLFSKSHRAQCFPFRKSFKNVVGAFTYIFFLRPF